MDELYRPVVEGDRNIIGPSIRLRFQTKTRVIPKLKRVFLLQHRTVSTELFPNCENIVGNTTEHKFIY